MLWICTGCTTAYSPDAPCCPHCGGTEYGWSSEAELVLVGEQGPELIDAAELAALNAGLAELGKPKEA